MASSLSQDFVQADRLIKRRYFQIPKNQRDLLDSDGAWSENLNHGPRSMVNVPPEVVEDIKKLNKRQDADSINQSLPVEPTTFNGSNASPRSSGRQEAVSTPAPEEDIEDDVESSPIPWSQSPDRAAQSVRYAEHVPSKTSPSKTKVSPASAADPPSSSAAQSEALEMQALGALSQESRAPVNRAAVPTVSTISARLGATPPSAQEPIIPSTFSGKGQFDEREPAIIEQRRREGSAFSNKGPEPRAQPRTSKASAMPPSVVTGNFQNSSTTTISTPPPMTQASLERPRQYSLPKATSRETSSNFTATWEGRRTPMATQRENLVQTPASSPPQPQARAAQQAKRMRMPDSAGQTLPRTQNYKNARTPYAKFKAAYPSYQESASIFVSALLYLEKLKRDWALPEFLYDDFVRAFSTGYLQYISMSGIHKADQILTAVQWYNDRTKEIQYRQNVITKDNIHNMVKAHATEVRKVRESVGSSGSEHGAALEEPDEDMVNEDEQDDQVPELAGETGRKEVASAFMNSPQFHVSSPGSAEVDTTAAPVQDEVLMSQLNTMNGEQLPSIMTATETEKKGQQLSEKLNPEARVERRLSIAKGVSEPAEQLVGDIIGEAAAHLIQNDAQVDEAAQENNWKGPGAAAEDDGQERLDSEGHSIEDNMAVSRESPELSSSPPKLAVTNLWVPIEKQPPGESRGQHEGASPSETFVSQEDLQMEDYSADDEARDDLQTHVGICSPESQREIHNQTQNAVVTGDAHHNGATPEVKATPNSSKSLGARQTFTKHSTPVTTSTTGLLERRHSMPRLSSSPPPSKLNDNTGGKPAHERPAPPATKKAQRSPAFKSQADSSDEESEAFDPPVKEVSSPHSRRTAYTPSTSKTQTQARDGGSRVPLTPVKAHMQPPQTPSRGLPAFKAGITSRTTVAQSKSSARAAMLTESIEPAQKVFAGEQRVISRGSHDSASRAGKSGSPASSERSYANVPTSRKRASETREERSRRLKKHFRRIMSGKTPSSSAVSRQ